MINEKLTAIKCYCGKKAIWVHHEPYEPDDFTCTKHKIEIYGKE